MSEPTYEGLKAAIARVRHIHGVELDEFGIDYTTEAFESIMDTVEEQIVAEFGIQVPAAPAPPAPTPTSDNDVLMNTEIGTSATVQINRRPSSVHPEPTDEAGCSRCAFNPKSCWTTIGTACMSKFHCSGKSVVFVLDKPTTGEQK